MASCEDGEQLLACESNDGGTEMPRAVRSQLLWYDDVGDCPEYNERLFDCWSDDDEARKPSRLQRRYCHDDASDSSLHSCHSADALKQWTTATTCSCSKSRRVCCPNPRCARTKRRRPVNLDRCSASCLLSDSSVEDDELDRSVDDQEVDADVDNETPALVEVMSCSSSFSDCSLPCHELVTFSSPSQLAKGRVKVSIRPPVASADSQRADDDRFNIKFVSHFIDDDNQETYNSNNTENENNPKSQDVDESSSSSLKSSGSSNSNRLSQRDSKNKNMSSKRNRNSSTPASEQSQLRRSYDDTYEMRGTSNSNRQTSKARRRSSSSDEDFGDEESSRFSASMSSSSENADHGILADSDKPQQLEEQEIVFMYGQIRQIVRGPAANDPTDVELLSAVDVADAEEGKETLSQSTVVTTPRIVDPAKTSSSHHSTDNQRQNTATVTVLHGGKIDSNDDGFQTPGVRSDAVTQAGRAACARIARTQPYKTQSDDLDTKRSSSTTPTNDVVALPWSPSAPQMAELRDNAGKAGEYSSMEVAAGQTTLLRGKDGRNDVGAAAAGVEVTESASFTASLHHSPAPHSQHRAPVKHCHRDPTLRRPDTTSSRAELEYLPSSAVGADFSVEPGVDPTERNIVVANVVAQPSMSLPPSLVRPLTSCLKYRSTSTRDDNSQLRRKLRFAEDIQQHAFNQCNR